MTEFVIPTSSVGPYAITAGPDGALWFTQLTGQSGVGRISTRGVITQYSVPTIGTGAIAAGPDGALWIANNSSNQIDRLTVDGVLTTYPLPTLGGSYPLGITAGPDGAMWFTIQQGYPIGRITMDGSITEYPSPLIATAEQYQILTGPDGALWFTNGNTIGRVTTNGLFSAYPFWPKTPVNTPDPGVGPSEARGFTLGSDGAFWITDILLSSLTSNIPNNSIDRLALDGSYTNYVISPAIGSSYPILQPFGITAGADGALWFTEANANKIGRITTGGVITEYAIPTANSFPLNITTGPDNAVWFVEEAGNKIGRVSTGGPASASLRQHP